MQVQPAALASEGEIAHGVAEHLTITYGSRGPDDAHPAARAIPTPANAVPPPSGWYAAATTPGQSQQGIRVCLFDSTGEW